MNRQVPAAEFSGQDLKAAIRDKLEERGESISWLAGLELRVGENSIQVGFAHSHFSHWFRNNWQVKFERLVSDILPAKSRIDYIGAVGNLPDLSPFLPKRVQGHNKNRDATVLGKKDIFHDFIANEKNYQPLAALRQIATGGDAGDDSGPMSIFLCGPSGSGKTHLLNSLHEYLLCQGLKGEKAVARTFCQNHALNHASAGLYWLWHDFLLVDDVQDLTQNEDLQNVLASVLDGVQDIGTKSPDVHATRSRIVLAATFSAPDTDKFAPRLRSRLEGCLIFELREPDLDVRLRYLEYAAQQSQYRFTREQMLLIARKTLRISQIAGILRKIDFFAKLNRRKPKMTDIEKMLGIGKRDKTPDWNHILGNVSHKLGLKVDDLLGQIRKPEYVLARQIAMYLCRRKLGLSYPELGRLFGDRDHTTVMYAVKKVETQVLTDKNMHNLLTEIEAELEKS